MEIRDFISGKVTEELSEAVLTNAYLNIYQLLLLEPQLTLKDIQTMTPQLRELFLQAKQQIKEEEITALALKISLAGTVEGRAQLLAPYDDGDQYQKLVLTQQIRQILRAKKEQYNRELESYGARKTNLSDVAQQAAQEQLAKMRAEGKI